MNSFILCLLFVTLAFAAGVPSALFKSSIIIGDHIYFTDPSTTLRTRAQAEAWCQSQAQGGGLAKVTNYQLYSDLRVAFNGPLTYWIDGIDKENHERFATTNNCTSDQLDFSDVPANNLRLPARTCLTLVKGSTASNSRIEAMDCIIPNRVLCSYRREGCITTTTTEATSPPPGGQ